METSMTKVYVSKLHGRNLIILIFAIAFAIVGLVILSVFLYRLFIEYSIPNDLKISLEKTGQTGDFIGGLVGSLWSFAGVLLFYLSLEMQREELSSQKEEMKAQINEFQIDRLTNISHIQIAHLLEGIRNITFEGITPKKGIAGILILNDHYKYPEDFLKSPDIYVDISHEMNVVYLASKSSIELNRLFITAIKPVIQLLDRSKTDSDVKSEIADFFLSNVDDEIYLNIKRVNILTSYWAERNIPYDLPNLSEEQQTYLTLKRLTNQSLEAINKLESYSLTHA